MTVYPNEEIFEKLKGYTRDELENILKLIFTRKINKDLKREISRIAMGVSRVNFSDTAKCEIAPGRFIPYKALKELSLSPVMNYAEAIIEAASKEEHYQTRDIFLISGVYKEFGMNMRLKMLVGYMLSMAGFDFVPKYNPERRMPVSVWVPSIGRKNTSLDLRIEYFKNLMKFELEAAESGRTKVKKKKVEKKKGKGFAELII